MSDSALAESLPEQPIRDYARLDYADIATIVDLLGRGVKQTVIAEQVGCAQATVSAVKHKFFSTVELAKLRTDNGTLEVADAVIDGCKQAARRGNPEPGLKLLGSKGVIDLHERGGAFTQVNVIGMPGSPAGPDPMSPVNVIANYQTRTEHAALTGQVLTDTDRGRDQAKVEGESQS